MSPQFKWTIVPYYFICLIYVNVNQLLTLLSKFDIETAERIAFLGAYSANIVLATNCFVCCSVRACTALSGIWYRSLSGCNQLLLLFTEYRHSHYMPHMQLPKCMPSYILVYTHITTQWVVAQYNASTTTIAPQRTLRHYFLLTRRPLPYFTFTGRPSTPNSLWSSRKHSVNGFNSAFCPTLSCFRQLLRCCQHPTKYKLNVTDYYKHSVSNELIGT